jgi:polysaccharide pyruvyl transferase WcaK-like protein
MVKITLIGWYGTETIGDRAIFAGLCSLFNEVYGDFEIRLGAIYPFFTERTLMEDHDFLCQCAGKEQLRVSIFDTRNKKELDAAIYSGDVLVMGGGPLMDMPSMFMVEYAFARAKKLRKKTMILGCGVGPLYKKLYERSLIHIIQNADITVFRDGTSLEEYERILGRKSAATAAIDPAVFAAVIYRQSRGVNSIKRDMVIASVREFQKVYKIAPEINIERINTSVVEYVRGLLQYHKPVHLLPMSYFSAGCDDRIFMNRIRNGIDHNKITVQNNPLNLIDTMEQFASAGICAGMRFHSVVLQTILNGNNMILDYTDPSTGKTGNFIRQIGAWEHYRKQYVILQMPEAMAPDLGKRAYVPDMENIQTFRDVYINAMEETANG